MYRLTKGDLVVELCEPGTYYRGTRFDWAGVFRRIVKDGYVFADEWFEGGDCFTHDHVCGPSEEFVSVSFDGVEPGGVFVKPGVGLLRRPDDKPYDWFRLYEIADGGKWSVEEGPDNIVYVHELEGWYRYEKRIVLESDSAVRISHRVDWKAPKPVNGFNYNHNFFTFDGSLVGSGRTVDFPFRPEGHWRAEYDNAALTGSGIRLSSPIVPPSVYMGDLHAAGTPVTPYAFRISEGGVRSVAVQGSRAVSHYVFWSNPRVACVEPYLPIVLVKGKPEEWDIILKLY